MIGQPCAYQQRTLVKQVADWCLNLNTLLISLVMAHTTTEGTDKLDDREELEAFGIRSPWHAFPLICAGGVRGRYVDAEGFLTTIGHPCEAFQMTDR
jgi:hypothetical protein